MMLYDLYVVNVVSRSHVKLDATTFMTHTHWLEHVGADLFGELARCCSSPLDYMTGSKLAI